MAGLRVAYIRVSTASGEQLAALETQRSRLQALEPDLLLEDVLSGLNAQRPQYSQLKRLVATGQVDTVLATRLDRLGRDAAESDAFIALCDQHGTCCRCLDEGVVSMATPEALLLTRLKGSLNQGESMRIRQRVNSAIAEGRKRGKPMRKPCWGYRLSRDRLRLEIDPISGPRALAFIEHLRCCSWQINTALQTAAEPPQIRTRMGVRVWLMNPTLRGGVPYGKLRGGGHQSVLWNQHPPLLSTSDYRDAMAQLERNRKLWGNNLQRPLRALTGLCRCGHCGERMRYIPRRRRPALACFNSPCSRPYTGSDEQLVLEQLTAMLAAYAAQRLAGLAAAQEHPERLRLEAEIQQLEALHDPDYDGVIQRKQQRLAAMAQTEAIDPELERKISDPRWFDLLDYDELTVITQQLVRELLLFDGGIRSATWRF